METAIEEMKQDIMKVQEQIDRVEKQIDRVEQQIVDVEEELKTAAPLDVARLREDKKQLREEKKQLRKEKEQLREEKLLLLKGADKSAGQATPEQDDRLQKLLEGFVKMMTERFEVVARKKSYRISEANSTVFKEIQTSGGVEGVDNVEVLFDARIHKARDVPYFKWGDGVESGQAAGYVKYVEKYLVQSNQKWSVINGNQHPRLLDGILGGNGEGTVFKGTTNVVVVEKAAEALLETGLKIIFELKKDGKIDKRAEYQTIISLLLANTTCRRLRPVAVLTDLVNMWNFYYCNDSTVYRHTFPSRSEAVGFLDAFLKGDIEPEDDSHDTSALRSPGESSSRGVKRSFTGRRKFSTPALEQLEELAPFLPEDELRQGRAAIALQYALNIPAFYSVISDLQESPEGMYS